MSQMFGFLIRKIVFAVIVALMAVTYYLWKNDIIFLKQGFSINSRENQLINEISTHVPALSATELAARTSDELAILAKAVKLMNRGNLSKSDISSYMSELETFSAASALIESFDKNASLKFRFHKGRMLLSYKAQFPDAANGEQLAHDGLKLIKSALDEWDWNKDVQGWEEIKTFLGQQQLPVIQNSISYD